MLGDVQEIWATGFLELAERLAEDAMMVLCDEAHVSSTSRQWRLKSLKTMLMDDLSFITRISNYVQLSVCMLFCVSKHTQFIVSPASRHIMSVGMACNQKNDIQTKYTLPKHVFLGMLAGHIRNPRS